MKRFSTLALPLLLLPSCSAFKLSEGGTTSSRTALGRASVAEGRGFHVQAAAKPQTEVVAATVAPKPTAAAPAVAPAPIPSVAVAPAMPAPQPVVAEPQPVKPVKPAERQPQATKGNPADDADKLRLPGDLNQLPGEKDIKSSGSSSTNDAPVIAKPPGAR